MDYSNLPIEIILNIYKYLSIKEILQITTINKHWHEASQHPSIVRKTFINVSDVGQCDSLKKSGRFFTNLKYSCFDNATSEENQCLFTTTSIAENIQYLVLLKFTEFDLFISILNKLKNLKELKIVDCNFNTSLLVRSGFRIKLNITSCKIESSSISEEQEADFFLSSLPYLKQLRVCYVSDGNWDMPIVRYLKNETISKSLKWLEIFSGEFTPNSFINKVFTTNILNLEYLVLRANNEYAADESEDPFNFLIRIQTKYYEQLKIFISRHTKLTHLDVGIDCVQLSLLPTFGSFKYVTVYESTEMDHPKERIHHFEKFWELQGLTMNEMEKEPHIIDQVLDALKKNSDMKELEIIASHIRIEKLNFQFVPQLTWLFLHIFGWCDRDDILQKIYKNLVELKELTLCTPDISPSSYSDFGITGEKLSDDGGDGISISVLKKLEYLYLNFNYGCPLTDLCFKHFLKLKNLKNIQLMAFDDSKTNMTNDGINNFDYATSSCFKTTFFDRNKFQMPFGCYRNIWGDIRL